MEALRAGDPDRIGPYRVLARLGAGGMGVVYLGRSRGGRTVAVKVIRTGFGDDARYRARFRREVDAARKVTGAFTAPVLDADPDAAEPWLATAYLPGPTLREAIGAHGPMPPDAVRALGAGLAEALVAVHGAGVVHRDLKPANVLLTAGGPRVIDFGIARPEDATAITRAGAPIGTPGFMSPEQVTGEEVGPPSDVFTLGAVLAYAASGREPFGRGPARSRLYRVMTVQADLDGLDGLDGAGHAELRDLIGACLRRAPGERPSAAEVLDRLGGTGDLSLQGTAWLPPPVAADVDRRTALPVPDMAGAEPPDAAGPHAPAPARRIPRRAVIAGIGGGALAVAAGGAIVRGVGRGPGASPESPESPRASATPPPRAVARWKVKVGDYYPDLYAAAGVLLARTDDETFHALDPRTGEVLWKRRAAGMSTVAGDMAYLVDEDLDLHAVRPASGKARWTFSAPFGNFPMPGPAVTGRVACIGNYRKKQVRALGLDDGRLRWTADAAAEEGIAAGDGVVAAIGTKVTGLDAGTGREKWTYEIDQGRHPRFAHGLFLVADRSSTVHAIRAADGRPAWRRPGGGQGFLLQAGGGLVFSDAGGGHLLALRAATGEVAWTRRLGTGEGSDYGRGNALGLSGGTLYVGCTDRNVYALDAATGRILWTYGADMTLTSGPVGIGGLAFTATRDGHVHALAPPAGSGGPHAAP
ncbi:serine/threonine-protein kinase [Actinomadura sp. 21ATH]|uniref:serine/threonine-protein kinase n=1 Tax=Actinomadura sp. 21ATH TaxID=1735444 RepID=UPI0035C0A661